jgi:hypothetical protein
MNAIDRLELLANLKNEHCELNHGPNTDHEKRPAIDYIVQLIGHDAGGGIEVASREMVIPICADCSEALQGNEWTLLYCLECCGNQWVNREYAKNRYRHSILWLRGCPKCTGKFGGLYFTEATPKGSLLN